MKTHLFSACALTFVHQSRLGIKRQRVNTGVFIQTVCGEIMCSLNKKAYKPTLAETQNIYIIQKMCMIRPFYILC